jgi:hypothetical protein
LGGSSVPNDTKYTLSYIDNVDFLNNSCRCGGVPNGFGNFLRGITMHKILFVLGAVGVVVTGPASIAQAATLTGNQLSTLTTSNTGPGTSSSISGGIITLTSPDSVGGGGLSQFNDTATVTIPSGFLGTTSLGTLSNLVSLGAAGSVSFDLATGGSNGQFAYWNVELTNGAHTAIINAFGDNFLGANPFNQGVAGNSSVDASVGYCDGVNCGFGFGSTWATVDALVVDGLALGSWTVASLTISVGGWDTGHATTDTIDSITLPGNVAATPIPAALPLFAGGLGLLGMFSRRRKQKVSAFAA